MESIKPAPPQPPVLSAYEQLRVDKIARNNALLLSLGLISKREVDVLNARARGETVVNINVGKGSGSNKERGNKKTKSI